MTARREVTDAALLFARQLGMPVGDGEIPAGAHPKMDRPYLIVWALPGGGFSGPPLHAPHDDVVWVYQVDAVGRRRDQVEFAADAVRDLFVGRVDGALSVFPDRPGWAVADREPDGSPGGITSVGEPPNRVLTASQRFRLHTTPASP